MKIIFFGTPLFAAETLKELIKNKHEIVATVTTKNKITGRKHNKIKNPVKECALENNIRHIETESLNDHFFTEELKSYNADLFVVVAFKKLPRNIWEIPNKGTINLHASLLPEYKGAAPINRVLINGEVETGLTTFFINERIDSGDIILQEKLNISNNMTAGQLHNISIKKGCNLLNKTILLIRNNSAIRLKQKSINSNKIAPKLKKELFRINWKEQPHTIHNLIRGLSPYIENEKFLKDVSIFPSAWFILKDAKQNQKRIKIQLSKIKESTIHSNHLDIDTDNETYLNIYIHNKKLSILYLQPEGKKIMNIKEFLNGKTITKDFKVL